MNKTNKFKSVCNFEFEQNNQGEFAPCLVQRIYKDEERKNNNMSMDKKCEECSAKKVEVVRNLCRRSDLKTSSATDTYCLCKNINWRETKLVDYYDTACNNSITEKDVEIVLQTEDGRRVLFLKEKGNRSFYNMMESVSEELWEKLLEENPELKRGEPIMLQMTDENGETFEKELYNERDIEELIISVRLVDFKEFEVDEDGKIIKEFTH